MHSLAGAGRRRGKTDRQSMAQAVRPPCTARRRKIAPGTRTVGNARFLSLLNQVISLGFSHSNRRSRTSKSRTRREHLRSVKQHAVPGGSVYRLGRGPGALRPCPNLGRRCPRRLQPRPGDLLEGRLLAARRTVSLHQPW